MYRNFTQLWGHTSKNLQRKVVLLLLLMIVCSFAEMLAISSLFPFLGALTSPDIFAQNKFVEKVLISFHIRTLHDALFFLTVAFIGIVIVAACLKIYLLSVINKVTFLIGSEVGGKIYRATIYQSYSAHVKINSSEIISGIIYKTNAIIFNSIFPALTIISSFLTLVAILVPLLYINAIVTLSSFGFFAFIYFLIIRLTKKRMAINSHLTSNLSGQLIKVVQEGIGSIRDILVDGVQELFLSIYRSIDTQLRAAQASNQFIGQSPRHAVEAIGISVMALAAFVLSEGADSLNSAIPMIGILALAAQRLLPILQQSYSSWIGIKFSKDSFVDILEILDRGALVEKGVGGLSLLDFNDQISLNNVSFRYDDHSEYIFEDLNLIIKKGERLGIIGRSGSGKSTLLDLIMGLLSPLSGQFMIDSVKIDCNNIGALQKYISHVPQDIFLLDASFAENIAFGVPKDKIDIEKVKAAAFKAQLDKLITDLPDGYQTIVGERGGRLSGGERQRIAIARALYKNSQIIILDEVTSSLDIKTEIEILNLIDSLDDSITIIMVAHKAHALKVCSRVVEVEDKTIKNDYSYEEYSSRLSGSIN